MPLCLRLGQTKDVFNENDQRYYFTSQNFHLYCSLCVCVCVCKIKKPIWQPATNQANCKIIQNFFQTVYTKVYLSQELDQASDDFFFQMAAPAAYVSSQAVVELELQLGPVPSHSSTRCICNLWLSFWQFWVLMLSEARDQTWILIETLGP